MFFYETTAQMKTSLVAYQAEKIKYQLRHFFPHQISYIRFFFQEFLNIFTNLYSQNPL